MQSAQDRMKRQHASAVPLDACLRQFEEAEIIDGFRCPKCNSAGVASKKTTLASFPTVLVTQLRRFTLDNWVPQKLSVRVTGLENTATQPGGPAVLDLSRLQTPARAPGEVELGESDAEPKGGTWRCHSLLFLLFSLWFTAAAAVDAALVAQLEQMGFPHTHCQRAVYETKNSTADAAMEWLFGHMVRCPFDVLLCSRF